MNGQIQSATLQLASPTAVAALWATLGLKATVMYVISGVALGVLGGYLIGHLKLERYVEDFVYKMKVGKQSTEDQDSY